MKKDAGLPSPQDGILRVVFVLGEAATAGFAVEAGILEQPYRILRHENHKRGLNIVRKIRHGVLGFLLANVLCGAALRIGLTLDKKPLAPDTHDIA